MDIKKYFNIKAIMIDFLVPYLEKFVQDTENPYDDKLVEAVKAWVEKNL